MFEENLGFFRVHFSEDNNVVGISLEDSQHKNNDGEIALKPTLSISYGMS